MWAVFDEDNFKEFDDAIILAAKSGVNCAFSNKAFEYWFYLHFENKTGAMSVSTLNAELEKKLGFEYGKNASAVLRTCNKISSEISSAEERAQIGHEQHILNSGPNESKWCSCTTVYMLTKRLRKWGMA